MAFTFGIKKIESGTPGIDGVMSAALAEHDETLKGTAVLETTEETITWIETEEKGKRLAISANDSETSLTFEVANPSLATMAYYLGGAIVAVGGRDTYSPPAEAQNLYKSFKITTVSGFDILIPFGHVLAKPLGGTITSDNVMTLQVVVVPEKPVDADTAAITFSEKAA